MHKPDFEKCTTEATNLLHKQDVSDRILNIQNMTFDRNIIFDSIQNYCHLVHRPISDFLSDSRKMLTDGCTIYIPGTECYLVLYNADITCFEHLNWTLGHEVGHIYLNHQNDDDIEEIEAHYFASQLFMPDYSIYMIAREHGKVTSKDLVELFGVSETAAYKRICTMNKRTCFCASKQAKEIWDVQKERVDMYFECQREGSNFRNTLFFWRSMKADYKRECQLGMYSRCY